MAPPGQRARRAVAAVVAFGQAAVRVREPVELEVLVGAGQLVQPGDDLGPAHRLLARGRAGRPGPPGRSPRSARRALRARSGPPGTARRPGPRSRPRCCRRPGPSPAPSPARRYRPGPGRCRGCRSGSRPATVCSWMSPMFARASPRAYRYSLRSPSRQPASTVTSPASSSTDRMARSPPGLQHHPAGHGDGGEGVARSRHPHGQAVLGGQRDRLGDLLGGARRDHPLRRGGLVTRPVLPAGYGEDHARTLSERAGPDPGRGIGPGPRTGRPISHLLPQSRSRVAFPAPEAAGLQPRPG